MMTTDRDRLLAMVRERGTLTAAEVTRAGIHSQQLTHLVVGGALERIAPGRYRLPNWPITEHHGLGLVGAAVPRGVICLLSALSFHGIGTELPAQVWIAIERGSRTPTLAYPPRRIVHLSGGAFTEGVENHDIEGQPVRIYSVAKTLADLFRFRNRIGVDVALEALREAWKEQRFTLEALDHVSRVCRVERVMRPYLQAIVT